MRPRHAPLPRLWLMTDERMGDALWDAVAGLPRGAGIVFRHLATPPDARRALLARLRAMARARGLTLLVAGRDYGAPHGRRVAASVHDAREMGAARRAGARLIFLSPAFPTRTHPGAPALGPLRFASLARRSPAPVIALGGMTARRHARLARMGADGWAAIDGLTPGSAARKDQKRKAVPR